MPLCYLIFNRGFFVNMMEEAPSIVWHYVIPQAV